MVSQMYGAGLTDCTEQYNPVTYFTEIRILNLTIYVRSLGTDPGC